MRVGGGSKYGWLWRVARLARGWLSAFNMQRADMIRARRASELDRGGGLTSERRRGSYCIGGGRISI